MARTTGTPLSWILVVMLITLLRNEACGKKNRTIPLWQVVDFLPCERFLLFSFSLRVMRQKPQSSNGHVHYFSPNTESCLSFPQLKINVVV